MTAADTIDHLRREITRLVAERQALRDRTSDAVVLESNRLEIGVVQRRLAAALIAHYA